MEVEIEQTLEKLSRGMKGQLHLLLVRVFWTALHLGRSQHGYGSIPTEEEVNKHIADSAKEELELENQWYGIEHSPNFNWDSYREQQKSFWEKAYKKAREQEHEYKVRMGVNEK